MPLDTPSDDPVDPSVIVLRGHDEVEYDDQPADGSAITPGMLLERTANGVQPHSTDGGSLHAPMVACGPRIYNMTIDQDYDAGELVHAGSLDKQQWFYGLLAGGETVAAGDYVVSAGDGTLRSLDQDGTSPDDPDTAVVGQVVDAVDNSGATANARVKVEVMD